MMKIRAYIYLLAVAALSASAHGAFAQAGASITAPTAELFRVEEGVFTLRLGQSIDITDKHLLLAVTMGPKDCLAASVGGRKTCLDIGDRYDLKARAQPFYLGTLMSDRQQCFLDVVALEVIKGAEPSATFRLHCV